MLLLEVQLQGSLAVSSRLRLWQLAIVARANRAMMNVMLGFCIISLGGGV